MSRTFRSVVAASIAATAFLLASSPGCGRDAPPEGRVAEPDAEAPDVLVPGRSVPKPEVSIDTDYGRIVVELFPGEAPLHVEQFLDLVAEGFYDSTTFHRVVPGFLIQGGDPNTRDDDPTNDGYGGLPERRLPLEISETLTFRRGTLGMARDYRLDSASTQFFISLGRASHIDGEYTIFGRVIGGMDVVDMIAGVEIDEGRRPVEPVRVLAMEVVRDPREDAAGDAPSDTVGVPDVPEAAESRAEDPETRAADPVPRWAATPPDADAPGDEVIDE